METQEGSSSAEFRQCLAKAAPRVLGSVLCGDRDGRLPVLGQARGPFSCDPPGNAAQRLRTLDSLTLCCRLTPMNSSPGTQT